MNNEMRSNMIWAKSQLIALAAVVLALILVTVLVDGRNPGDGIIRMYNIIFVLFSMALAGVFPLAVSPFATTNIQFGANRKQLFWAIEKVTSVILIISFLTAIGMNSFSTFIYGANETGLWEITPREWIYMFVCMLLVWKMSQRAFYAYSESTTIQDLGGLALFKGCLLIGIVTGVSVISLVVIRGRLTIETWIAIRTLDILYVLILLLMCVGIILLERKNYGLFMKAEV